MRFGEGERGGGEDASARYSRSTCGRVSFRADRFGDSTKGAGAFGDPGERSDGLVMIICGFAKDSDHDIRDQRLDHRDMEDRVDCTHAVRKSQSVRPEAHSGTSKGLRYFSASFFEGRVVRKNCALTNAYDPIANLGAGAR
jgi:hypothetical protein